MIHDPGSYTPDIQLTEISLSDKERDVLKNLGEEIAEISALPVHKEKAKLWRKVNDLESERPVVWINEIPWHEMNVNDELTIQCQNHWARDLELKLRKEIYQWKHMPGDMIVSNFLECPLAIHSTDFGIIEDVNVAKTDDKNDIVSRHFNIQIKEPEDIAKIKIPNVTCNKETTNIIYETMESLYKDIIPVKKVGLRHIWFTPWDYLVRWWGIQEVMVDLIMRPKMVHDGVERLVRAWMIELDQFEEQNLLSLNCNNTRIGSGGYGYTKSLPGNDFNPGRVKTKNMWGCSNAQIFTGVSPEMHAEFAIEHDLKWLKRWDLTYYGCCEVLDKKIHILRKIPNLRKISISPWCDIENAVKEIGNDYVMSIKPSPAIFTGNNWDIGEGKEFIREVMQITEGKCHVEFIMKDISTVGYKPQRLWKWESMVMKTIKETVG